MYTTHIGLLDQDPVRLITPLLDESIPSDRMIFIGVDNDTEQYQRLATILNERNITTEFFTIPDVVSTRQIRNRVFELATRLSKEKGTILYNASCGLKHRLLSIYEVFRSFNWPIYVIEPFSDRLCWLYPEKEEHQVHDKIKLADYLAIFGARSEFTDLTITRALDDKLSNLGHKWAQSALELGPGLATLNYLATTCRKEQRLDVALSEKQQSYRELGILLDDLQSVDLAKYENGVLTFAHEQARRFSNGEWLEVLVNNTVRKIKANMPTIQDYSQGIQVHRKIADQEVKNELDVTCIVNNKLHIIECKTKGMSQDGDDTLYKLDTLRDLLGGLQARAMLVSFRPLKYYDLNRANDLGLAIIGPDELGNLYQHLYDWFHEAGGEK